MQLLVTGSLAENDSSATEVERRWERSPRALKRGFRATAPRLRIQSYQVWPGDGPSMYQRFKVQEGVWDIRDELPFFPETENERRRYKVYDGNGLLWLDLDCKHDHEDVNWRWSRSDAFATDTVRLEKATVSSSSVRRQERIRARLDCNAHQESPT